MSVEAQTPADGIFIVMVGGLWAHGYSGQEGLTGEDTANAAGPEPTVGAAQCWEVRGI